MDSITEKIKAIDINLDSDVEEIEEIEEDIFFYFKSNESINVYSINTKAIDLVDVFKNMYTHNPTRNISREHPLVLSVVYQPDENKAGVYYKVNTDILFSYVSKYLDLWQNKPLSANYIPEDQPIQTGNPSQVLRKVDLDFIEGYINDKRSSVEDYDEVKYLNDLRYNRRIKIRVLSELLAQVCGFLGIQSLSSKIFAYIATLIWNCTIIDIVASKSDPYFDELQNNAILKWKSDNRDKVAKYTESATTGDGKNVEKNIVD
jgi:hypothetical protein